MLCSNIGNAAYIAHSPLPSTSLLHLPPYGAAKLLSYRLDIVPITFIGTIAIDCTSLAYVLGPLTTWSSYPRLYL